MPRFLFSRLKAYSFAFPQRNERKYIQANYYIKYVFSFLNTFHMTTPYPYTFELFAPYNKQAGLRLKNANAFVRNYFFVIDMYK